MCRASKTRDFDHRTASLTRSPRCLASQRGLNDASLLSAHARSHSQFVGATRPIPLAIQNLIVAPSLLIHIRPSLNLNPSNELARHDDQTDEPPQHLLL